jgi:signal transduction histidine kinase
MPQAGELAPGDGNFAGSATKANASKLICDFDIDFDDQLRERIMPAPTVAEKTAAEKVAEFEAKIAELEQQLYQAQKLTALGELASTVTHEFNNVLMTIVNYAKLGLRQRDDESRTKAFDKILAAGNRAAKMTNGVLGFARNRAPGYEPTDLARVVDDTMLLLERELTKYRVKVECYVAPVPQAIANANQIQQVLMNLLINARQAMPNGGRITIRLSHDAESNTVDLLVRDNGTGIPADKLPHIFDSFFTTKSGPDASGKGGTGLGLSMCRNVIEAHHGKIRVESTVGKGTAFTLKLPVAKTASTKILDVQTNMATATMFASPVEPA